MENLYDGGYVDVSDEAMEAEKNMTGKQENSYAQNVFDAKNYLNVRLAEGETSRTIKIRLLPFPETKSPFLHAHMHTLRVPKEISASGWKSYICLEKTEGPFTENLGKKCPFCDVAKSAFKDMKAEKDPQKREVLKQRGKENSSKEVVFMRCIERGKEDEGVKFWKTNVHQTKDDPYNLILTLYETRKAEWFADPDNKGRDPKEANILSVNDYGYDLQITIKKKAEVDKNGKTVEKTSYQVTDAKKPSPLSNDVETVKKWVMDPKKWYEVFVPKPYDYLAIVMQGKLPWFDRATGKWVTREENDQRRAEETEKANEEIKKAEKIASQALSENIREKELNEMPSGVFGNSPEDDLPF